METSGWKRAALFLSALVALVWSSPGRADDHGERDRRERTSWVGTWATGPAGSIGAAQQFGGQTLRQIIHTSAGGERVRVRISNTFGSRLEADVVGAAITSALEVGVQHWEEAGARQPLKAYVRRALLHLGRLGAAAPRGQRR
jgi:hypothetical protein